MDSKQMGERERERERERDGFTWSEKGSCCTPTTVAAYQNCDRRSYRFYLFETGTRCNDRRRYDLPKSRSVARLGRNDFVGLWRTKLRRLNRFQREREREREIFFPFSFLFARSRYSIWGFGLRFDFERFSRKI